MEALERQADKIRAAKAQGAAKASGGAEANPEEIDLDIDGEVIKPFGIRFFVKKTF